MTRASAFFCASGCGFCYSPLRLLSGGRVAGLFICFRLARSACGAQDEQKKNGCGIAAGLSGLSAGIVFRERELIRRPGTRE